MHRTRILVASLTLASLCLEVRVATARTTDPSAETIAATDGIARQAELRAELASHDSTRMAWAARAAAMERQLALVPELLAILASDDAPAQRRAVRGAVLDALILLDAHVPARSLADLLARGSTEALILAARDPAENVDALALVAAGRNERLRAVAWSLLFRVAPRRAAHHVLRAVSLTTSLVVRDGEHRGWDREGQPRTALWFAPSDDGLPHTSYEIVRPPADDIVGFDSGVLPFGWRRHASPHDVATAYDAPYDIPASAIDLIEAVLADEPARSPLEGAHEVVTAPSEIAASVSRARAQLDEQRERWNAVLRAFHSRGWIDFAWMFAPAPLEFVLRDERIDRKPALPRIEADIGAWLVQRRDDPASYPACVDDVHVAELRAGLASDSNARRAWAACAIAASRTPALGVDLRKLLTSLIGAGRRDERAWTASAVFDALIRSGASVPSAELFPWLRGGFDPELVRLAANDPSAAVDFLAACASDKTPLQLRDLEWIACCNLLARAAPERFVELATRELSIDLLLHVVDSPGDAIFTSGYGNAAMDSIGTPLPASFPPIAGYALRERAAKDAGPFTPSPTDVTFLRCIDDVFPVVRCRIGHPANSQRHRLALLSEIAGEPWVDTALAEDLDARIEWSDAAAFQRDVRALRDEVERVWGRLVAKLLARKLLSPASAAQWTPIHARVRDERSAHDVELPPLDVK